MAAARPREGSSVPTLRREAAPPVPHAMRRPCAVVGVCIALVFAAAALDAAMWSHGIERHELESEVRALEAENEALRGELRRAEIARDLHEVLYESEQLMREIRTDLRHESEAWNDMLVLPEALADGDAPARGLGCDDPL